MKLMVQVQELKKPHQSWYLASLKQLQQAFNFNVDVQSGIYEFQTISQKLAHAILAQVIRDRDNEDLIRIVH